MTEQNIKNNWYTNIVHLLLQFAVSWFAVGYVRIHILDIPYYKYDHDYNFYAVLICILFFFLLHKKGSLEVTNKQLIGGVFTSLLAWFFVGRTGVLIVSNYLKTSYHPYIDTAYFYAHLFALVPFVTYILAFINKKVFMFLAYLYIVLSVLSIVYMAL